MRKMLMGVMLLSALGYAGVSQAADGTVNMTWDSCTGPINKTPTAAIANLYISVQGIDVLHKAYDVRFIYGDAAQTVPDAWRFDTDGCETGSQITQNVTAKACPAFHQLGTGALQIKKVEFSPLMDGYATSLMRILLADAYQAVPSVNPATNYLLENVAFDLSFAVAGAGTPGSTCGGLDVPVCFKLNYATYLDLNGIEIPFGRANPALAVTVNDPVAAVCSAVPVKPKTWGAIKNQYRN